MQQEIKNGNEDKKKQIGVLKFENENYDIVKGIDFSELGDSIKFLDERKEVEIAESAFDDFQIIFNDEIVFEGMDNQDTVNEYGVKLYRAYDEMLEQCE